MVRIFGRGTKGENIPLDDAKVSAKRIVNTSLWMFRMIKVNNKGKSEKAEFRASYG